MRLVLRLRPCRCGDSLPLLPAALPGADTWPMHCLAEPAPLALPMLPVGTILQDAQATPLLKVTSRLWLPTPHACGSPYALCCPLLTALTDLAPLPSPEGESICLETRKQGRSLAWITLSDKGAQGLREDSSGPVIAEMVAPNLPLCHSQGFLLPDEPEQLRALLMELALGQGYDLICTTGGTGLSPRDTAPQVTSSLLDLPLPGFSQAMLAASLAKTPHAAISRAVAGVLGKSIIINLPGSRKAVLENLAAVLPALPHALDKLHGDTADCGG